MSFSLAGKCGMILLVAINLVFFLLGIGLMIVGIIMRVNSDVVDKSEVITTLNEVSFNDNLSLGNLASGLSILVIVIGGVIALIAFFGACGACCKNRCMLIAYALIVILILVAQVVAVALWFTMRDKVENKVKEELEEALKKYEGPSSTKEVSIGWDLLFIGFDCCGVDDVGINNRVEFQNTVWYSSRGSNEIPYSCCKKATEDNYKTGVDAACTDGTYTDVNSDGCYETFKDWLNKYQTAAIVIGVILIVLEILLIIFAFIICRDIGKSDMIV